MKILDSKYWFNWKIDLKFVSDWNDLEEIELFIEEVKNNYNIDWIYIMPLWTTLESQNNTQVLDFCIEKWYNYCLRQHLIFLKLKMKIK